MTWRFLTGEMSSNYHVDARASKRRKWKDDELDHARRTTTTATTQPSGAETEPKAAPPLPTGNHLIACYLAYEFLSRGTLLGRRVDRTSSQSDGPRPSRAQQPPVGPKFLQVYAEVSHILKGEDVHLPRIVNPSQLARWIGM